MGDRTSSYVGGGGGEPASPRLPPGGVRCRWLTFSAPFAVLAAQVALKLCWPARYAALNREGGVVEGLQVAVLLLAAAVSAGAALRARRAGRTPVMMMAALVALGFLFVAGEEVSWGQRLLGLSAPEFFRRHNTQGEITLHNVAGVSYLNTLGYGLAAFLGAFGWLVAGRLPGRLRRLGTLVPAWYHSSWFFVAGLTYAWQPLYEHVGYGLLGIAVLHRGGLVGWNDQEPAELMLYVGTLLCLWQIARREAGGEATGEAAAVTPSR